MLESVREYNIVILKIKYPVIDQVGTVRYLFTNCANSNIFNGASKKNELDINVVDYQ